MSGKLHLRTTSGVADAEVLPEPEPEAPLLDLPAMEGAAVDPLLDFPLPATGLGVAAVRDWRQSIERRRERNFILSYC